MGVNQRSQITMTDEEVATFLEQQRTATIATIGPSGAPHLVAMWYAVIDGQIWFETKSRSQKAVNLGATHASPAWSRTARPTTRSGVSRSRAPASWSTTPTHCGRSG